MKRAPPMFNRYLASLALTLLAALGIVVLTVAVIDPYGIYGYVNQRGFNGVKPGLTRYQNEIKLTHALAQRPSTVILGNSRAEIGFDPASPALAAHRVYNLAIPGTGVATAAGQLAALNRAGVPPRTVIVGLEFLDFLADPRRPAAAKNAAPTAVAAPSPGAPMWQFETLFSLTALKDALRTVRIQHDTEAITMSPQGFNPLLEYRGFVRQDGYYPIFEQRAHENLQAYRRKSPAALAAHDLQALESFLLNAAASNADIRMVIYPYHAQILLMFEETGLWQSFEQWKQEVLLRIAHARQRYPSARIQLVDFSGYGPYNCERIPAKGKRRENTRWYWEAGHFKKELGDVLLQRLLLPPSPQQAAFGMELEAGSMQANRRRIAAERAQCAADYPELFQYVNRLAAQMQ